jgi:type VI secretion system protein ImpL
MTGVTWLIVLGCVVLVGALLVAAFLIGRRARTQSPSTTKARPASSGWREILDKLPAASRRLPVVVVLGERGSGKSRLIQSAFAARSGFTGDAVTARDACNVSAYAPGHVLVQEVAGELFEAEGSDGLVQLHDLWRTMALEIALVVFVGGVSTPPERQAPRMRRIVDLLTELRGGSAPRACICVTRLDETTEGFAELVSAARQAGSDTQSAISVANAEELRAAWGERFRDCYYAALATLPAPEFARAVRFPEQAGPELARYVDSLLRGLVRGRASNGPTLVALSALPELGATALLGDPFAPDEARIEDDRRVLERRRALRSGAFAVAACGLVAALYAWHYGKVERAESALGALRQAAAHAKNSERKLLSVLTAEPEMRAVAVLDGALTPLYLPLRLAFPSQKAAAVQDLLAQIRALHLEPLTVSPERATRVYAASLLFATNDGPLGRAVRADPQRWATTLAMPLGSVEHYVRHSKRAFPGRLQAARVADHDIAGSEWSAFFERLDAVLARGRLERPEELSELQAEAERLTAAMRWAVQEPELRQLIQLLELERGKAEVELLLGGADAALLQAPAWVVTQRDALQAVLTQVKTGNVGVPSASGKSLRQALSDLDAIGASASAGAGAVTTLEVAGKVRTYSAEGWSRLLSQSRASFYMDALLRDLSTSPRALFFIDPRSYPDLAPSPVLGRGPSASIAGMFTPAAFVAEIRDPLSALDATLEAAKVSNGQRASLKQIIVRELDAYATGLAGALFGYLQSFRFDAPDTSVLRTYVADMVSGSSWFAEFWANIAASASVPLGENPDLRGIHRAVSALAPVATLMTEDKGAYPNLQPYNAILAKLLPALTAEPLLAAEPRAGTLAERVPPIGKLGLALLDAEKPGPLQEVEDWLTKSNVLDEKLREPFRLPVRVACEQALRAVEQTAESAYSTEMRPLVSPLFAEFPFDPSARVDAVPAEVQAVLGPKGSFSSLFRDVFGPVTVRDRQGNWQPRKVAGYRSLALSREALDLGRWAAALAPVLWNESGAPRAIPLVVRPVPLAKIETGAADAPTLAVLRSGSTTVAAFNQATTWKTLPIEWWSASPAALGLEFTAVDGASRRALSAEAPGAAWRFFHLLRRASLANGVARWSLDNSADHDVAFELQSDPWQVLVPPLNKSRFCVLESPWDGT